MQISVGYTADEIVALVRADLEKRVVAKNQELTATFYGDLAAPQLVFTRNDNGHLFLTEDFEKAGL